MRFPLLLFHELVGMAVQPFSVNRVERVLHDLEPVARNDRAAQHADRAFGYETVKARQQRLRFGGAEVGPEYATHFLDRVGRRRHLVAELALLRLVRLFETLPE